MKTIIIISMFFVLLTGCDNSNPVQPPVPEEKVTLMLVAVPSIVAEGEPSVIYWYSPEADSCILSFYQDGRLAGYKTVSSSSNVTFYPTKENNSLSVQAFGKNGNSYAKSISVSIK